MKVRKILPILILALLVSTTADAQKRRNKKKEPKVEVEETVQQKLYKTMLPATQKIMFVDSVDAKKEDFMKSIKLSSDIGRVVTYADFFNKKDSLGCYGFINGFGNKCYFAAPTSKGMLLYTADKLDGKWKNSRELKELNTFAKSGNHPYLMTDGTTLYFSAKSDDNSLGGYDIFVTSFDSETGTFLEPQNIGMPFNSEANDYMYIVDDIHNVGWFVTDRHAKEGHVTIYTFVPNDVRTNYDIEKIGEEKVKQFADIHSYKDTWTSKSDRNKVLERIKSINTDGRFNNNDNRMAFAVNNNTIYHSPDDFKSRNANVMYYQMAAMIKSMEQIENSLEAKRIKYHNAPESKRSQMAAEIIKLEKQYEQLKRDVKQMHKDIINEENRTINKKG